MNQTVEAISGVESQLLWLESIILQGRHRCWGKTGKTAVLPGFSTINNSYLGFCKDIFHENSGLESSWVIQGRRKVWKSVGWGVITNVLGIICLPWLSYRVKLSVKIWGERHGPLSPLRPQGLRQPCIFPLLLHIGVFPVLSISSSFIYIISEEITWLLDLMTVVVKLVLSSVNQSHGST